MARLIALNAIFFLLPFAGYAGWLFATQGSAVNPSFWPARRIGYLAIGGAVLLLVALFAFTSFEGAPAGSKYKPAAIGDNGQIIPGHFE